MCLPRLLSMKRPRWGLSKVSTEDLRQGLRRYRSFFERLLAASAGYPAVHPPTGR